MYSADRAIMYMYLGLIIVQFFLYIREGFTVTINRVLTVPMEQN